MAKSKTHNLNPSNKRSAEEWAQKFDDLLAVNRRTLFDIGDALLLAEQELSKKAFAEAIARSGIKSKTTANNYMRVAESATLRDVHIQKHLPSTVGTLIDLAAWSKEEIGAAIKDGALHPSVERGKLKSWRDDRHGRLRKKQLDTEYEKRTGVEHIEYPQDAIVVGYVKADPSAWAPDKWGKIFILIERLNAELGLNDVYVTQDLEYYNSATENRLSQICKKMIAAFKSFPLFSEDPYFKQYWKTALQTKHENGVWDGTEFVEERDKDVIKRRYAEFKSARQKWNPELQCRTVEVINESNIIRSIRSIALHISSSEFAEVHKKLKFSDEDWNSLGVISPGNATITPFLEKETKKPAKKVASAKIKSKKK